jgi:hypothetical protein
MLGDREEFPDCRLDFDSLRGVHSDPLVEPECQKATPHHFVASSEECPSEWWDSSRGPDLR